jgi:hypothetical protein
MPELPSGVVFDIRSNPQNGLKIIVPGQTIDETWRSSCRTIKPVLSDASLSRFSVKMRRMVRTM